MSKPIVLSLLLFFTILSAHADDQIIPLDVLPGGYMKVPAKIYGIEGVFIIDTAATGSVIDNNKLAHFGLEKEDRSIEGFQPGDNQTGRIQTFPIKVNSVSIGNQKVAISHLYANDMSGRLPEGVLGLIGQDVIQKFSALLDIEQAQLILPSAGKTATQRYSKDEQFTSLALQKSPMGFHFIDVVLGKHQAKLIVDTGAPEVILDENMLNGMSFTLTDHPTAKNVIEEGVELPMKVLAGIPLTFAGLTLKDEFLVSDFSALLSAINQHQDTPFIGVLGAKQLMEMGTIIDIANAKLYIKR